MTVNRKQRWTRWRQDESGSAGGAALELLLIAPVLIVFALLIVAGGRYWNGQQAIASAAASAARAASLQSGSDQAQRVGTQQGQAALADVGQECTSTTVSIDTGGFAAPAGQSAVVTATVTCTVSWSDLAVPGLPGSKELSATSTSPLDIHREARS